MQCISVTIFGKYFDLKNIYLEVVFTILAEEGNVCQNSLPVRGIRITEIRTILKASSGLCLRQLHASFPRVPGQKGNLHFLPGKHLRTGNLKL